MFPLASGTSQSGLKGVSGLLLLWVFLGTWELSVDVYLLLRVLVSLRRSAAWSTGNNMCFE